MPSADSKRTFGSGTRNWTAGMLSLPIRPEGLLLEPDYVQPDMLYADVLDKCDEQLAHLCGTRPMVVG